MNLSSVKDWLTRDYDFFKKLLVISGSLGLVLFGLFLYQWSWNGRVSSAIENGEAELRKLYLTASQIDTINGEVKQDALADAKANITYFLKTQAYNAGLGDPDVIEPSGRGGGINFEDKVYTIKPSQQTAGLYYSRDKIARFLHLIESGTSRAKITSIKLDPPTKNFVSGSRREDEWSYQITVTSRRRVEKVTGPTRGG